MQFDIRRFDIYRKVPKDLTQPTYIGACISLSSVALILYLFTSELYAFLSPTIESVLYVDDPGEQEQLPVNLDITLHELKCDVIGIDIQDDMGRHEVGNFNDMVKTDLETGGCRLQATFKINKVSGNFHVSTHAKSSQAGKNVVFKHTIHQLLFGESIISSISKHYGLKDTSFEPLNGFENNQPTLTGRETFEYHLKIVPTVYAHGSEIIKGGRGELHGYQFTALKKSFETNAHGMRMLPAIWFRYQLTPITVKYVLQVKPFYHFLTTVCAIVGGTFTVAGIIDSCLFTAHEVFRKIEMGKIN